MLVLIFSSNLNTIQTEKGATDQTSLNNSMTLTTSSLCDEPQTSQVLDPSHLECHHKTLMKFLREVGDVNHDSIDAGTQNWMSNVWVTVNETKRNSMKLHLQNLKTRTRGSAHKPAL